MRHGPVFLLLIALCGPLLSSAFSGCVSTRHSAPPEETTEAVSPDAVSYLAVGDSLTATEQAAANDSLIMPGSADSLRAPDLARADSIFATPSILSNPFASGANDSLFMFQPDSLPTADSLETGGAPASDSLNAEAGKAARKESAETAEADTTIDYSAEKIDFDVQKRITVLTGNARITYKDFNLEAHRITIDWDNNLLTSTGTADTVWADSAHTVIKDIIARGIPTFKEKGQTMTGRIMKVNMETKEGYVVGGETKYEEGFYHGDQIQKISDKVLYVKDGSFTTCDLEHPHYRFTGSEMKVIHRDKVVGKPVVLRFGDVPVFALPFAVFSIKPGRQSGLMVPVYGDDSRRGRQFRNLGYYFAASRYWDAKVTMDFFEKTGMFFRSDVRYNVRRKLSGSVSGSFDNQILAEDGPTKRNWDLRVIHNQDINPTLKLRVNGTFVSAGDYYRNYSDNASQRINQKINSNATITKSWPGTGKNISINLSHQQNLLTDENSQNLPNINFSFGTKQLFPSREDRVRKEKNVIYRPAEPRTETAKLREEEEQSEPWYRSITYSYRSNLKNLRTEKREGGTPGDITSGSLQETFVSGVEHNFSLNAPQKVAKYITVNPRLSYREDWFNERWLYSLDESGDVTQRKERGFFQRRTFNTGVNTSTKLYGYFNINRFGVRTIRHVATPTVNFSYRPDFSIPEDFGYYQELIDWEGDRIRRDRYSGSAYGGTPKGRQMAVSFGLNNLFQMKTVSLDEDGEEVEKKTDLFTYNLSTNFDFARDSLNWGNMNSSFRASPITSKNRLGPLNKLAVDLTASHSFYQYRDYTDKNGFTRRGVVNSFYWEEPGHGLNFLRLASFSANASFALEGGSPFVLKKTASRSTTLSPAGTSSAAVDSLGPPPATDDLGDRFLNPDLFKGTGSGGVPWRLNASLRYNLAMNDPQRANETLRLTGTVTVNLTKTWRFSYTSGVDLISRDLTGASLSVTRDLHCWQGSFSWSPVGYNQGFYLLIGIKAAQLRDIKVEQRRGGGGTLPSYR